MTAATLAQELEPAKVDLQQLYRDYKPMLHLVRELIGVVPNCDPYLEIWPTGFRTYNLLVPNLLNLPAALFGQGAPKDLVGLAMYVSSRAAQCMYCSAHTCSFALRRGATPEAVIGDYSPVEAATASIGESLGKVPSRLTLDQIKELEQYLSPSDVEWVVLSIGLMGFLNKFMDAMGIQLEPEAIADVKALIEPTGWTTGKHQWSADLDGEISMNGGPPTDSLGTYLRVLRQAPGAIRLEAGWTKGVSGRIGPALVMLEERIGYAFPILATLRHKKPVKAIAAVLRHNLDPDLSELGMAVKCLAAMVFAKVVDNEILVAEAVQLADLLAPELDQRKLIDVGLFAVAPVEKATLPSDLSSVEAAAVSLAKASSTSPSGVTEITISSVTQHLSPPQIVELVVWLSVLQMLHRLYIFYDAKIGLT
jgi:alkylhydroperoxidase family enzyme